MSLVGLDRNQAKRLERMERAVGRLTSLVEGNLSSQDVKEALNTIRIPSAQHHGVDVSDQDPLRRKSHRRRKHKKRSGSSKRVSKREKLQKLLKNAGSRPKLSSDLQRFLGSRVPSSSDEDADFGDSGDRQDSKCSNGLFDPLASSTLARILNHHRSVYHYVHSNSWNNQRSMHEARRISVVIDSLLDELGAVPACNLMAMEMLVRNLVGLRLADDTNSTSMLEILELAPPSALLPKHLEQSAFKAAKRLDTFRGKTRRNTNKNRKQRQRQEQEQRSSGNQPGDNR